MQQHRPCAVFFDNRGTVSWDFAPAFDAAHRAVLEAGKPLVYVCAPAAWPVTYLFAQLPATGREGLETLAIVPTADDARDVAAALHATQACGGVHPVTGLVRTERLLRAEQVGTLVATAADALYLLRRSALKSDRLARVVVLWPETVLAAGEADDLDTVLGDAPKAQRVMVTADEKAAAAGVIERHARRAPVAVHSRVPERGTAKVRYAAVEPYARVHAARAALDILAPKTALVWEPTRPRMWEELVAAPDVALVTGPDAGSTDLLIAAGLPSVAALAAFGELSADVLVLLRPSQIPYLERIVASTKPLRLRGDTDRVWTDAAKLRDGLRSRLRSADLTTELLAVAPLLDEYDPALVAAAALGEARPTAAGARQEEETPRSETATWTRLYVTAGRRDRVRQGDVLKTFTEAAGLTRSDVGRIELMESFLLVEVRPETAEHAIRCVTGRQIGGRRVTVRLDRHESSGGSRAV